MSWIDGFEKYAQSYEVRLHKRTKTFGGKLWPRPYRRHRLIPESRQLEIAMEALDVRSA